MKLMKGIYVQCDYSECLVVVRCPNKDAKAQSAQRSWLHDLDVVDASER